jgi:hypothetical protein
VKFSRLFSRGISEPSLQSTVPERLGGNAAEEHRREAEHLLNTSEAHDVISASVAQEGMWLLAQIEPETAAYNLPVGLRLRGALRREVLEGSLDALIKRHESLRTVFELRDTQLMQVVSSATDFKLHTVDLSSLSGSQVETEAYSHVAAEATKVFDLARGPLFRAALIKVRADDHILICVMHHIISDGWSTDLFVRELTCNYAALSRDMNYRPEPLPIQYGDYALFQREWLHSEAFDEQLAYWRQKLKGSPPLLELPCDRARPAQRRSHGCTQSFALDPPLVQQLKVVAQAKGATFFMLALAAFNVLLYRYCGQTDILIGVPAAGRNQIETESLIGLFVNTVVLRTDLSGNPKFSTLLAQVQDVLLQALANQDVPFERIVEELQPVRSLSYNPLFQVMFATFQESVRSRCFGDLIATPYIVNTATSRFDLSAALIEGAHNSSWIKIEYDTALFDYDRISRMLGHYDQLLRSIV